MQGERVEEGRGREEGGRGGKKVNTQEMNERKREKCLAGED